MVQSIDLENTNVIMFNGQEVETLQLNGAVIWKVPAGFVFTGLDVSGKLETEDGFNGTIVAYMLGDNSQNACNGLDLSLFNLNSSSIIIPNTHNGLPVLKVGKNALVPIGTTSGEIIVGDTYFENPIMMPNLTQIKFSEGVREFDASPTVYVDYSLNCSVDIPNSVEIFKHPNNTNNAFTVKSSTVYDNRSDMSGDYDGYYGSGNIKCNKLIIGKDVEVVGVFYNSNSDGTVAAGFAEVEFEIRTKPISLSEHSFQKQENLTIIRLPNTLSILPLSCFQDCTALNQITIPANVTSIGDYCFGGAGLTSIRFEHSSNDTVILPTAGNTTGMLYSKTAKEMTIYTDNETIKNYDYATDNITATILHLDGSAW